MMKDETEKQRHDAQVAVSVLESDQGHLQNELALALRDKNKAEGLGGGLGVESVGDGFKWIEGRRDKCRAKGVVTGCEYDEETQAGSRPDADVGCRGSIMTGKD